MNRQTCLYHFLASLETCLLLLLSTSEHLLSNINKNMSVTKQIMKNIMIILVDVTSKNDCLKSVRLFQI